MTDHTPQRGYRRVITRWLMSDGGYEDVAVDDAVIDDLFLREANLIRARRRLAEYEEGTDAHAAIAAEFDLTPADIHGLGMDLDRYGEFEVVDS